ncbi:NADH-quinone oxidoreductase subunit NuoK [Actinoplanes friuliensis]|jgi:NADH-quinone oxidoreductase subunit K|uniref:NADH-quinone oxidoreductase subunit K n=1 Tax=Actinoplanes friuliensis DSM 7358 TaxID=1246995 RepID=U5VU42_9ACTN|nr:NADH-quinone oxidoreductase subunit NuoK [Actinoplanes friuliensis]AGZ39141.1 putative NADH dehydrogenase I chain K [Actinoplanes friuliensis DSM 7358]
MHAVIPYVTAALLFGLGVYGVLRRRNAILVLMAVELMLNAINLIFITADASVRAALVGVQIEAWAYPNGEPPGYSGGVFALFIIVLAAAEVGVGLAIVLQYYRMRQAVHLDEVELHHESDGQVTR